MINITIFFFMQRLGKVVPIALFSVFILLSVNPNAYADLNSGLIAYYPFNGNADDESGNGHDGTTINATLANDRFGDENSAYYFDGYSNYITTTNNIGSYRDFSISVWYKLDNRSGRYEIIQTKNGLLIYHGTNDEFQLNIQKQRDGGLYSSWSGGYDYFFPSSNINCPLTDWIHFVYVVSDDNTAELYANGSLVDIGTSTYYSIAQTGDYEQLFIGCRFGSNNNMYHDYFSGWIDDVRIYNRALTAAEVAELWRTTPTVTTIAVSSITSTSASSGGNATSDGGYTVTAKGVCWSISSNPTTSDSKTTNGTGTGSFTSSITGLSPDTTYQVRAYATNSEGTTYGSDVSFTTLSVTQPSATTSAANPVSSGSATLNGLVNPNGVSTTAIFEYGITTGYGSTATATPGTLTGTSSQSVSASITGLNAGSTYHFRVKATNNAGTTYGSDYSLTTASAVPTVVTSSAGSVSTEAATLNGTVNPNGASTTYYFQYGKTSSYGLFTAPMGAGSGSNETSAGIYIVGLNSNTMYHYRLVAYNGLGTTYGDDKTFTTAAPPATTPTMTTGWATSVTDTSAKLNGTINPNGADTTYYFEYGTTTSYGSTTTATSAGSGTSDVSVNADLTGLGTSTTYHFRLKGANSAGTINGSDLTFTTGSISKTIIVSGGGQYAGNNIWTATEMISGYAFRALLYQGYTKDNIYFLSPNTSYDVDGDNIPDVDVSATGANLENAIKSWAQDASKLFLYMIGHGHIGTYRINANETLSAENLDAWLDDAQNGKLEHVVILYDTCRSGSFLPLLVPQSGKQRILATSASSDQNTLFSVRGTLSFSYLFWSHMFNGDSFYECFTYAKDSVSMAYPKRMTSQIEANGNGVGNEKEDKLLAEVVQIGDGITAGSDLPSIGGASPPQTIQLGNSALIYATDVIALAGVKQVWAAITPPGYSISPDDSVTELPTVNLSLTNGRYDGTYSDLTTEGTYNIAIFVEDKDGFLSLPVQTVVNAISPATTTTTTTTTTSTTTTSTTTTLPTLSACSQCSVSPVVLTGVTFSTDCECSDSTSITVGTGVTIKSGANSHF